jgi:hypothetical protein
VTGVWVLTAIRHIHTHVATTMLAPSADWTRNAFLGESSLSMPSISCATLAKVLHLSVS